MTHCDECIHLRWQSTLFLAPKPLKIIKKRGREDVIVHDPEAGLLLDTPHGYCNVGTSITFQMPTDFTFVNWGYRPTHRCGHFTATEVSA